MEEIFASDQEDLMETRIVADMLLSSDEDDLLDEENIVAEMLSSSSSSSSSSTISSINWPSSSDEEDIEISINLFKREPQHRVQNFVESVVHNYSEKEFRSHFRVSRKIADHLIYYYQKSNHFKIKSGGGRKGVSAESQCLAFLWFAGNKETYRKVPNLFNVTTSAAYTHLKNFMEFLFEISTAHIKFPTTENEKKVNARDFEELAGFPNVIGCVDGCYIYIRKPVNKIRSTYVNRHGSISITLQGICDANKKILDICIRSPSKIHDSRIFKLSPISAKLPEICGEQYHILGDAAYPLRKFLLTPYKDYGNLSAAQIKYNKKHCQTRVKIENTFGLLKQRFRQLMRLDFFSVGRMCKFILGCCVIYNLCIDNDELWEFDESLDDEPHIEGDTQTSYENVENMSEDVLRHLGEIKRFRELPKIFKM